MPSCLALDRRRSLAPRRRVRDSSEPSHGTTRRRRRRRRGVKLPFSLSLPSSFSISTQIGLILRRSATSVIPLSLSIFFTFYHFISHLPARPPRRPHTVVGSRSGRHINFQSLFLALTLLHRALDDPFQGCAISLGFPQPHWRATASQSPC